VFSTGYLKKAAPSTQSRFPSPPTGSLLLLTLIRNFLRFFSFFFLHHTRRPHINSLLSAQTDLLDVHFAYPRTRCKNPGFIPFSFPSAPPEFLERNFTSENWWYHHLIYHQQLGFDLEKQICLFYSTRNLILTILYHSTFFRKYCRRDCITHKWLWENELWLTR
jgi:hypothetical protein